MPLFEACGRRKCLVVLGRDVTEQKQLQAETDRANRLASLGELAAGIAHEINNPNALVLYNSEILTAIFRELQPYLRTLAARPGAEGSFAGLSFEEAVQEIATLFPAIKDAAERIKRIVNDLRDFARVDAFDSRELININDVVQAAVRLVHNTIKKTTDHFEVELGRDLPLVSGVKGRLEQVMINLLLNACQALTDRGRRISVSTSCSRRGKQVEVKIQDEGKGMSEDLMGRIFEPFVTTRREAGGTGLGLSVSDRIVKEHQGTLHFQSVPGRGTTATLVLPAVEPCR